MEARPMVRHHVLQHVAVVAGCAWREVQLRLVKRILSFPEGGEVLCNGFVSSLKTILGS